MQSNIKPEPLSEVINVERATIEFQQFDIKYMHSLQPTMVPPPCLFRIFITSLYIKCIVYWSFLKTQEDSTVTFALSQTVLIYPTNVQYADCSKCATISSHG
jgi:hypothetical protein